MSDEIAPALTAEEWATGGFDHHPYGFEMFWNPTNNYFVIKSVGERFVRAGNLPHKIAAALLHQHPHGFTQEDVDACRLIGEDHEHTIEGSRLVTLAARIAALLPLEGDVIAQAVHARGVAGAVPAERVTSSQ